MARSHRIAQVVKWVGTVLAMLLVLLFLYNTRRAFDWTGGGSKTSVCVGYDGFSFGWRPDGWRLEDDLYAASSGWRTYGYGGYPDLGPVEWWITSAKWKSLEWIAFPIWMPFLLIAIPTVYLWYRNRRYTRAAAFRWIDRIRPKRRKRMTVLKVIGFSLVHAVAAVVGSFLLWSVFEFFFPSRHSAIEAFFQGTFYFLFLPAPLWGIFWVWAYVRVSNRLLLARQGHYCLECGYNLTGNVSGRCSECGAEVNPKEENPTGVPRPCRPC